MKIQESIEINAPADKVWDILWHNYGQVCDWASTVNKSSRREVAGNEYGGRACHSAWGEISEIVDSVDESNMSYSYFADGLPKMMKSAKNRFSVHKQNVNTSRVDMDIDVELAPVPKILMGWKMKKDIKQTLVDLKHYAETDQPTEKKIESDKKFDKKNSK